MKRTQMKKQHWPVVALLVSAAVCLFSCLPPKEESTDRPDRVSVRLKWVFTAHTAAGPGVAQAKGFFAEEGLEVTLNPGGFEHDPITLVASGSEHFGIKGADDILLARSKGIPVVAIAVDYQENPVAFMSKPSSGISQPEDFVGRNVGVKHGQNVYTFYKTMLRKRGVPEEQIEEVPVRFDVTPFLSGDVDVFPGYDTFEPAIFKARGVEVDIILARDYGVPSYGNVVFTSEETLEKSPEVVTRFLRAYIRGWQYAVEHPDEAASILAELNPDFERSVQLDMMKRTIPYIRPEPGFQIGTMTREGWQETQRVMIEEGILEKEVELESAYTTRHLAAIH